MTAITRNTPSLGRHIRAHHSSAVKAFISTHNTPDMVIVQMQGGLIPPYGLICMHDGFLIALPVSPERAHRPASHLTRSCIPDARSLSRNTMRRLCVYNREAMFQPPYNGPGRCCDAIPRPFQNTSDNMTVDTEGTLVSRIRTSTRRFVASKPGGRSRLEILPTSPVGRNLETPDSIGFIEYGYLPYLVPDRGRIGTVTCGQPGGNQHIDLGAPETLKHFFMRIGKRSTAWPCLRRISSTGAGSVNTFLKKALHAYPYMSTTTTRAGSS